MSVLSLVVTWWTMSLAGPHTLAMRMSKGREAVQAWSGLEVLENVIGPGGPLVDQELVLYVTQNPGLAQDLLALPAIRATPRVLVQLGPGTLGGQWVNKQPAEMVGGTHLVHVAVFVEDPRPFFRQAAQDNRWSPVSLLLVYLGNEGADHILTDQVFSHVQRLALLRPLSFRGDGPARPGLYTFYPLAQTQQVVLYGLGAGVKAKAGAREVFLDRFPTFTGVTLHIGTWFDDYPYLYQSKTGPEGDGDGVAVEMLEALASHLHYEYTLTTEPPDQQWGALVNGSWTGMLGMVHRRDKNFTVNSMTLTDERVAALDASQAYWMEGFGLTLLIPPPLARWRAAHYPFHALVWFTIMAAFMLLTIIMALQDGMVGVGVTGGKGGTWAYLLRPMLNHSLPRLPTAQWQRVFMATWVLSCFILTTAYTANLIAFLTIPVFPERIQTLEQLAASKYRVAMSDYGDFVSGALLASESPVYRALGQKLDLSPGYDKVIQLMADGSHAFLDLYSYNIITVTANYKIRNVYMLREQLYPGHLCWYFQKNTAWRYKFDGGIQRLVEAGLIAHWLQKKTEELLGREGQVGEEESPTNHSLSLQHLQAAFLLLLLLSTLCFIAFFLENFLPKC